MSDAELEHRKGSFFEASMFGVEVEKGEIAEPEPEGEDDIQNSVLSSNSPRCLR